MSRSLEDLTPPLERELPTARRREIRAELVRATRSPRRHRRAWVVAVPLLVLVLLGVMAFARSWTPRPPAVGVPSSSPSGPASLPPTTPTSSAPPTVPVAEPTDRGALSTRARQRVVERCTANLGRRTSVAALHFARRTAGDGDVVLFTGSDGQSYLCSDNDSGLYAGPGSKTNPLPAPSRSHPVVLVMGRGVASGGDATGKGHSHTAAAYRVSDQVASLQLRLTVEGHHGRWFEASRERGYAWASADIDRMIPRPGQARHDDYSVQARAFDASGGALDIDDTPR